MSSSPVSLRFGRLNAFAIGRKINGGNPAAIVVLPDNTQKDDTFFNEALFKQIAIEMDLPETAFLSHYHTVNTHKDGLNTDKVPNESNDYWLIRWFTWAGNEEKLCGHATLASASFLYTSHLVSRDKPIHFISPISGSLFAKNIINSSDSKSQSIIQLNFPALPVKNNESLPIDKLHTCVIDTLNLKGLHANKYGDKPFSLNDLIKGIYESKLDLIIEFHDELVISDIQIKPSDFAKLVEAPYRGIIVTALSTKQRLYQNVGVDIVSRVFFHDVQEDPVTGSAHCALAPFWANKLNRVGAPISAYQASSRGGLLNITYQLPDRVLLEGEAFTLLDGHINV